MQEHRLQTCDRPRGRVRTAITARGPSSPPSPRGLLQESRDLGSRVFSAAFGPRTPNLAIGDKRLCFGLLLQGSGQGHKYGTQD